MTIDDVSPLNNDDDDDDEILHRCVGIMSRACSRAHDITAQMESMLATGTIKNSETGLGLMQVSTRHFVLLISTAVVNGRFCDYLA